MLKEKKYIELFNGSRSVSRLKLEDIDLYSDEKYMDVMLLDDYKKGLSKWILG